MLDLISRTYDAAIDEALWPEILSGIARLFGAKSAGLVAVDHRHEWANLAYVSENWPPELAKAFFETQNQSEAGDFIRLQKEYAPCRFVRDVDFYGSKQAVADHPVTPALREGMGVHHRAATVLSNHGAWSDLIAVQFEIGREPITDAAIEKSALYLPHVAKTIEIARPFQALKQTYQRVLSVLDRLQIGVVIVDGRHRVVVRNNEADRILAGPANVSVTPEGQLRFATNDGPRIEDAIMKSVATARAEGNFAGSWHLLGNEDGEDIIIDVVPLSDRGGEVERGLQAAAVFLTDPANRASISETGMQQAFGLTDAEFSIVTGIFNGLSTEAISETRGTTLETTRSQIKSALRKTGSETKTDLVRLATKLNPPVDRTGD